MSSEEREDDTAAPAGGDGGGSEDEAAAAGGGKRVLTARKLEKLQARAERKGVVYLSRVPPFMKPVKLRHLLSQHGEVLRIYLAAEDATARVRRKRSGGNSGKKFTEGWVEFADKKVAKRVAAALNGEQIGGPRRSAFYYDLWNIKYLSKFKWEHLTEELSYQKAVKEQRLALELASATRERDFYLKQVDHGKAIDAMSAKQQRRAQAAAEEAGGAGDERGAQEPPKAKGGGARVVRTFQQRPVQAAPAAPRLSHSVLAQVFGTGAPSQRRDDAAAGGGDEARPRKKQRAQAAQ